MKERKSIILLLNKSVPFGRIDNLHIWLIMTTPLNRPHIYPLGRSLNTSQTGCSAGGKASVLPVVSHLTVLLLERATEFWRHRALVTGFKEAGSFGGWFGAFTLLLRELSVRLCEREEHSTPHLTHLNTGPTCGAAG